MDGAWYLVWEVSPGAVDGGDEAIEKNMYNIINNSPEST